MWYNSAMKLKWFIIFLLVLLGISIPVLATDLYWAWIPFLSHTQEYPIKLTALFMALSAFITLLLALAAVRTIEEANNREEDHRKDELSKEKRDREERYLNEVKDWATGLVQNIFSETEMGMGWEGFGILSLRLRRFEVVKLYILGVGEYFSERYSKIGDNLYTALKNILNTENGTLISLEKFFSETYLDRSKSTKGDKDKLADKFNNLATPLIDNIDEVLKIIAEIKTKHIIQN